jgi:subtilisin family serine protease
MRTLYNETNGQKGAFIVATNSSFGVEGGNPDDFSVWCAMYDTLGSVGILNCVATANENWNIDSVGDVPSACSSDFLIAVTNTTPSDNKYTDAGYGVINIDIGAPGTDIYSTLPNNTYGNLTGTSMATPQVAGVIALMYANMPQSSIRAYKNNPASFTLLVRQLLLDGADKIAPLDGLVNSGRLNAYNAVQKARCTVYFTDKNVNSDTTVIPAATLMSETLPLTAAS